jgi:hypothetical protein
MGGGIFSKKSHRQLGIDWKYNSMSLWLGVLGSSLLQGGDFESIATVTVGSGGASEIEFTSIPGTYQHLQIRMIGRSTSVAARCRMRVNGDSTSTNYSVHLLYGDGAIAQAAGAANYGKAIGSSLTQSTMLANAFMASIVDVVDYGVTTKNKTIRSFSGLDVNNSGVISGEVTLWSSAWLSTSAITSVSFFFDTGNFAQHSTAALYGIKA